MYEYSVWNQPMSMCNNESAYTARTSLYFQCSRSGKDGELSYGCILRNGSLSRATRCVLFAFRSLGIWAIVIFHDY